MDAKSFINSFHFSREDVLQILNIFNKVPGIYYFYGFGKETFFYYVLAPMIHSYRLTPTDIDERLKYKYYNLFYVFDSEMNHHTGSLTTPEHLLTMKHVQDLATAKPVIIMTMTLNESCIIFNTRDGELFSAAEYYRHCTNLFAPQCIDYLKQKAQSSTKALR